MFGKKNLIIFMNIFYFELVSSIVIGIVLGMGFFGIVKLVLWVVLVDCVLVGLLISTIYWFVDLLENIFEKNFN
jgi:hypothetical protein